MKEFLKSNKVTYNLMSFTGFKSLVLFSLLIESPKTYEQICDYFENHEYIKERISLDTLRVYITSLKKCGCTVERHRSPNGGLYSITSHPYEFKLSDIQIKSLIKIYNIILKNTDVSDLLIYERFLNKLAKHIKCTQLSEALDKVSIFKGIDNELIENLVKYSKERKIITFLYDSPNSGEKEIKAAAQKIAYINNKLYLCGVSLEYKQNTEYLLDRIKQIIDVDLSEDITEVDLNPIKVGYEVSTLTPNIKLNSDEKIVEIKDGSIIVETETTNMFDMKRRILEFGPLCTVLYPQELRSDIIQTLKKMQKEYDNEFS